MDREAVDRLSGKQDRAFWARVLHGLCLCFGLLMGGSLLSAPVLAQVLPPIPPIFDPTGRSGEPPAPLKEEFQAPPTPPPSPTLPEIPSQPQQPPGNRLGNIRVFVRDITVTGSTVFSDAELAEVTAPYRNRELTTEDLERVRLELTMLYVNKGYITSGAVIPDQDVTGNLITIQMIEGTLVSHRCGGESLVPEIRICGTGWLAERKLPSISSASRNGFFCSSRILVSSGSMPS